MATNYDQSQVGVPFNRVKQMSVVNILGSAPVVTLIQECAVQLADTTMRSLGPAAVPEIDFTLDLVDNLTTPIPLVDPVTGAQTGQFTTLQQALAVLQAVARQQQVLSNP